MQVRNQIIEAGNVVLDVMMPARTDYAGLHGLLKFEGIEYNPSQFYRSGDWVCYTGYSGRLYRTMSSRRFG